MTHRISRHVPNPPSPSSPQGTARPPRADGSNFADVVAQLRRSAPIGGDAPLRAHVATPPPSLTSRAAAATDVPAPGNTTHRTGAGGLEALTRAGRELVERVARGERSVERIVRQALSGRDFTPADLLALQAQMYRYAQEIELVSKVVDRGTSGLRTLLQQSS